MAFALIATNNRTINIMIKHDGTTRGHPEVLDGLENKFNYISALLSRFHKEKIYLWQLQ